MEDTVNVHGIVQQAIDEYMRQDTERREPAYKVELQEERRRREQLEKRLNEMAEENKRSRAIADEAQRSSGIRSELQRLGVTKVDLAYRAVQDGITRSDDGRLVAKTDNGDQSASEYLSKFVQENPEFLPARIPGGSGITGAQKSSGPGAPSTIDIESINASMSKDELDRVRLEILRVAQQALR